MSTPVIQKAVAASILVLALIILIKDLLPVRYDGGYDFERFGSLPVQEGGRVKPLDTVARTSLMVVGGKQTYRDAEGDKRTAIEWLAELVLNPQAAARRNVFRIDHPDLVGLLGFHNEERKYFSMVEIATKFDALSEQFATIPEEAHQQNTYHKALAKLSNAIAVYDNLSYLVIPPPLFGDVATTYVTIERLNQDLANTPHDSEEHTTVANAVRLFTNHFQRLSASSHAQVVPPLESSGDWMSLGDSLLLALNTGEVDSILLGYEELSRSLIGMDASNFNRVLEELHQRFDQRVDERAAKVGFEHFFNSFAPFYYAMEVYLIVLIVAAFSWLGWARPLAKTAFWLLIIGFLVHTFGMIARIYIQERPPVTNLYSSAIFVSWGAIPLCLLLERRNLNGMASAAAAIMGFTTLIIAHHLSFSGDTMEVMRAVLDSNFWLATHVPTVTVGYSASFLAGFLGIVYIARSLIRPLEPATAKSISGMVYGTICFALLFSFVGTVLGGIWADQSWGRFWGWDPKENGALMIVLWNALILHARWAKISSDMGIMQLAIVGNIITAWSWFGTNMLGVGLHSYGFMDSAFLWLVIFVASQVLFIGLGSWISKRHKQHP